MTKIIITENKLKQIIRESVNKILKEAYKEPRERKKVMMYPNIIESSEAAEIAYNEGYYEENEEWKGAKAWFEGVAESYEFELQYMPKYHQYICDMPYIESELYFDYGANYYFCIKKEG